MEKRSTGASPIAVISGVAGLLTATAALVGLLVTFGVIGGKDSDTTTTTGGATTGGATTEPAVAFSVSPKELTLTLLGPEGKVTVTNTGGTPVSVHPAVAGSAKAQFSVKEGSCNSKIVAGDYCELTVKFTPGSGVSTAVLTVSAQGAPAQTVSLEGKPL
jgi:hypothetical protein